MHTVEHRTGVNRAKTALSRSEYDAANHLDGFAALVDGIEEQADEAKLFLLIHHFKKKHFDFPRKHHPPQQQSCDLHRHR